MLYAINGFIAWALSHALAPAGLDLTGATLPVPLSDIGTEPWHYLYGSTRVQTDPNHLDYYYTHHYYKQMTRERFNQLTADWLPTDYATDCEGLCDAYLTYPCGEKTDINANMNYTDFCTDKGKISEIDRPYIIGEAVFEYNGKKMNHIGWVCGFAADGVPLVVEARGIYYGVTITRMDERNWKYRGIMAKKFTYGAPDTEPETVPFELRSPILKGEPYRIMQEALRAAGYTDNNGKLLNPDGKWGPRSQATFNKMIADYAPPAPVPIKHTITVTVDGAAVYEGDVE